MKFEWRGKEEAVLLVVCDFPRGLTTEEDQRENELVVDEEEGGAGGGNVCRNLALGDKMKARDDVRRNLERGREGKKNTSVCVHCLCYWERGLASAFQKKQQGGKKTTHHLKIMEMAKQSEKGLRLTQRENLRLVPDLRLGQINY